MCPASPVSIAPPPDTELLPERLFELTFLHERGYGSRHHILNLINAGRVPAVKVGKSYKIRESDLHLLVEPVKPSRAGGEEAGT